MHTSEKTVDINIPVIKLEIEMAKCSKTIFKKNNIYMYITYSI